MPDPSSRPKAVLFCQSCDHESPPGGDWLVRDRVDGRHYSCPDCGHTITIRRSYGDERPAPFRPATRAVGVVLESWLHGWAYGYRWWVPGES